jgi:hypothetical protein
MEAHRLAVGHSACYAAALVMRAGPAIQAAQAGAGQPAARARR